ncbi:MAG: site-specific integrase [Pseudomonadota bacterium]
MDRSTKSRDRAEAQKIVQTWIDAIDRDALSPTPAAAPKIKPTFFSAAVAYMQAGGDQRFLEKPVNILGQLPLDDITQATIDAAAIASYPKASNATRNRQFYTPVSAVMRHVGHHMALRRPKGAQGKERERWLTFDEAARFLNHVSKIDGELATLYLLAIYTGMRRGELFNLRWCDVLLSESTAHARKTKNGRPRPVHLPPTAVAALADLPGERHPGTKLFRFNANGHFSKLSRKIRDGLPPQFADVTLHVMRHTYGTWMRRYANLDDVGLAATKAWASPKSTHRYSHAIISEEARKADLLPAVIICGKSVEKDRRAS